MTDQPCIRVLIVDDHPVVRDGLISLLAAHDDLSLCAEVGSGHHALRVCQQETPDVILMDMVMPGMDGPQAIEALLKEHPTVKIVALTSFPEPDLVQRALQAGAISYLLKNADADTLANAIRAAYSGHSTLAPEATQVLTQPKRTIGADLTPREREALALVVAGKSNEEIAEEMVVSLATAKRHVSACIAKLGAANRAQTAALAVQHGLVTKSD